jgi:hypothetical protein
VGAIGVEQFPRECFPDDWPTLNREFHFSSSEA